jgi:MFS family permease
MYQLDLRALLGYRPKATQGVGRNVLFLGLTSFFTDVSSEMVSAVLPIYLVFALHRSPLQFGLIEGLYQGVVAFARLAGGVLADRWGRTREIAATGYALSAVSKLGLLAAGNAFSLLSGAIAADRVGKGIRTAPRDALISLSSAPASQGAAFGIHRAMDTAGALLGPLVAFALLALFVGAYDVIFVTSFFVAVVGLAVFLLFVTTPRLPHTKASRDEVSLRAMLGLLAPGHFRTLVLVGCMVSVVTVSDSFIYLGLQSHLGADLSFFPLLYVGTALSYLLLAVPAGRLADRFGRGRVFLCGQVLLILACGCALIPSGGLASAVTCLALLGAYYACTDGVLMAIAAGLLPPQLRASGMAVLTTGMGLARLLASVAFGALWDGWGLSVAFAFFMTGLAAAMLLSVLKLRAIGAQ